MSVEQRCQYFHPTLGMPTRDRGGLEQCALNASLTMRSFNDALHENARPLVVENAHPLGVVEPPLGTRRMLPRKILLRL